MTGDQSSAASGLDWRAGEVPVSTRFGDPYYSLQDGLAEARHVFLAGNGLPGRLTPGFRVAELGVGTGLNLLALAEAAGEVPVLYLGFEAFPLTAAEVERALAPFASLAPFAGQLVAAWRPEGFAARIGSVEAGMVVGDARRMLPVWQSAADAWFLDGFAPARNPELWEPSLMAEVARHTAPGGTFATYTAAGAVRRSLAEAGFAVERAAGYGRKRHMSRGVLAAGAGP
ncbi:FAD-dependent oxidoreductase [Rhodovulum sp. 12E13]|uniref:tRNA (5-methylaminomethyl-2-thiouridine)(34)-methyltransferase MnmD n=1 Tax=Rhodovulum sp. 12E13 TaxID=2203891 RepID=UPI000E1185F2|nr:tRNA (5-methylaminomethyl-2-thiouridine)(34)-methyltransferase MnmD [Rhodovulum sp. 12E13]RDC73968.1 FAD-dependent oxidoreductase [Rhodovulum sp. 12E13]